MPTPVTLLAHPLLAQSASSAQKQVLIWVGVLLLVALAGGIVMFILRRRMFDKSSEADAAGSLMDELRAMRKRGEISEAEFDRARRSLSDKVVRAMDAKRTSSPDKGSATEAIIRSGQSRLRTKPDHRPAPPGYDLTGDPLPKPPSE